MTLFGQEKVGQIRQADAMVSNEALIKGKHIKVYGKVLSKIIGNYQLTNNALHGLNLATFNILQ